jgi:YkoP domain
MYLLGTNRSSAASPDSEGRVLRPDCEPDRSNPRRLSRLSLSRLSLQLARPRLSLRYPPRARAQMHLGGRLARRRGVSRTARMMWRLVAHGVQPGEPHGLLVAWLRWEQFAHYIWPISDVPRSPNHAFGMRIIPYRGDPVVLGDGTRVEPGVAICELHCNNAVVLGIARAGKINPYRAAREDLQSLARWIAEAKEAREVRAIYGFTLLGSAAGRLGFAVKRCSPSVRQRFERMFMTGLLVIYSRQGLSRIGQGSTVNSYPCEVWMSRRELVARYGPASGGASRGASRAAAPHLR